MRQQPNIHAIAATEKPERHLKAKLTVTAAAGFQASSERAVQQQFVSKLPVGCTLQHCLAYIEWAAYSG